MKKRIAIADLENLGCDDEGLDFAGKYRTVAEVWDACESGHWLLWLLRATGRLRKWEAVRIAIACARRTLPLWEERHPGDRRPRRAIRAVEAYLADLTGQARAKAAAHAADAAGDDEGLAGSYAHSCVSHAYRAAKHARGTPDRALGEAESRWQAAAIRRIVQNPLGPSCGLRGQADFRVLRPAGQAAGVASGNRRLVN